MPNHRSIYNRLQQGRVKCQPNLQPSLKPYPCPIQLIEPMPTVNNTSSHHLTFTPRFQSCLKARLASSDSATTSTLAPGESTALSHPKYIIGALHVLHMNATNQESTSTIRSADDGGIEVTNGGHKTLVFKSSDDDDIVIKTRESASLQGDEYDVDVEDDTSPENN